MFEANYRIEARSTGEVMEFETFKAAYRKLIWLRKTEGSKKWPYLITNIKNGDVHDFFIEEERQNEDHMNFLEYTWDRVLFRLDLVDDSKTSSRLWVNLREFAYNMYRATR